MVSLDKWLKLNIKRPFYLLTSFIVILEIVFFIDIYKRELKNQKETSRQLVSIATKGIIENNRKLIEDTFALGLNELKATSIVLCRENSSIIYQGQFNLSCKKNLTPNNVFYHILSFQAQGMPEYSFHFVVPRYLALSQLLLIILISSSFLIGILSIIFFIQNKLKLDVFVPLFSNDQDSKTSINEILDIQHARVKTLELEKQQAVAQAIKFQSLQVAHDIRSPLAALNMIVKEISGIKEEERIILRGAANRIQDIANELLNKNRFDKSSHSDKINNKTLLDSTSTSLELISSLLERIVSEKRVQYRSILEIEIELQLSNNSYGLFAKVSSHNFNRVISNIINNAVEATSRDGKIVVELTSDLNNIFIRIKDNGKGIPEDIIKKLGSSLGESYSKENGNGIGLYHAKSNIESWGGNLLIESDLGKGSTVNVIIPKAIHPKWFVPEIKLSNNTNIVILDDDATIHNIWKKRFEIFYKPEFGIIVFHLSMPSQVRKLIENNELGANTLYLFDYELIGQNINGLDLINELGISNNSILVTSHFDENKVLAKCSELNVKLIPKSMAESVPIIMEHFASTARESAFDAIYFEDDKYLRNSWELSAKEKNIRLLTLGSTKSFNQYVDLISKDTKIYIDRELGMDEPKGEVWAKELFEMGFKNIFLATGYSKDYFPQMYWIVDIIEKEAPFA